MRIVAFARGAGLAIVFALMVFAGMAAGADECAAADTTDVPIDCGKGHETFAGQLAEELSNNYFSFSYDKQYYEFSTLQAASSGTTVTVTCPDADGNNNLITIGAFRKAISIVLTHMSGNSGNVDVHGYTMDNGELLWNSDVAFAPSYVYESHSATEDFEYFDAYENYQAHVESLSHLPIFSYSNSSSLYLLWKKPYNRTVQVTIDTPLCGSKGRPSVTCDTLSFVHTYSSTEPFIEPEWFTDKKNCSYGWHNWVYRYKDALEGGTPYYACAVFHAPWGYYFPNDFSSATINEQPAGEDVWSGFSGGQPEEVYIGSYITPDHVWGAWTTVKKATALNAGLQQRVCAHDASHIEKRTLPATGVKGLLLAQMKSSGKTKLYLTWTKVTGAEGYDIFFAKCNSNETKSKYKYAKSIKGNKTFSWTKSGLKKNTSYKAYVKAFAYKNGKKTYVRTSPGVHAFTSGGSKKYTNPKSVTVAKASVTLKKSGTFKIKGKVNKLSAKKKLPDKGHGAALRYYTSNKAIATVSSAGKITAKAKGKCTVYVLSISGVRKAIAVTVK